MKIFPHAVLDTFESVDLDARSDHERGLLQQPLLVGLTVLLIFAVLAFGAVNEWSTFAFEAGAGVLLVFWVSEQIVSGRIELSKSPLYPPAFLFFSLIFAQLVLRRSAYRYVTEYELLKYVSYGVLLLIATEYVRTARARKIFALIMVVFGTFYAFFALAQELTANGKIFWVFTPHFQGSIYGSYLDRDHYAGLMEMLVPIPFVLSMGHLLNGAKRIVAGACAVLMATTTFLSGSRGGMLAFVLEMMVFSAVTLAKRRSPRIAFGSLAVCGLILALLVFLGKGKVLGRLGDLGPGIRLTITKDSLRMFAARPVLGWGLGTFPTVYPSYRSFYTNLFVNEAHNDYAQLLVETGLVGFVLMLWFVISLYRRGWPTSRRWEFKWDAAVSFAALLGCTGILFHSFVDFNMQIPANAAIFYVLCGLAASRPAMEIANSRGSRSVTNEKIRGQSDRSERG